MTAPAHRGTTHHGTTRRRPARAGTSARTLVVLLVAALALTGCGPDEQELRTQRLREATAATFGAPFSFGLGVDAPADALTGFGQDAAAVAGLLADLRVAGAVDGGALALGVAIRDASVAQLRAPAADATYLRVDLASVLGLVPGSREEFERQLLADLTEAGVEEQVQRGVLAGFRGEWIELRREELAGEQGTSGLAVAGALRGLLDAATVTDHLGRLEGDDAFDGQLSVTLGLADVVTAVRAALAGVDAGDVLADATADPGATEQDAAAVTGTVLVQGGRVTTVTLLVGPALAALGVDVTGDVGLTLELQEGTADAAPTAPDEVVASLTSEQLRAALAVLTAAGAG